MKNIITGLLLLTSVTAHAQNIKGKVCLLTDRTPLQFATVGLHQLPDSTMVTGVITLTDGGYNFEKIKPGNYYLKASFVGYNNNGKSVIVDATSAEITVDTIYLSETTTTLNEVTVTGERMKGKEMVDRTVYAIPQVVSKSSATGYDILKKIPQVNVDFRNNVTLNGSSNFIIQVDGRKRDKEFLAKLLPTDIASVEVINNPSGKYEGNIDGVINIILKKEARYGMNGNVGLNIKPFNRLTAIPTTSLDYAMGKITFYVTGYMVSQKLHTSSLNESHFTSIDSTTSMTGTGGIKVTQSTINSGIDYYLNERNNISFNISYKPTRQNIDMSTETFLYKGSDPLNTISALTGTGMQSDESSTSFFYKKTYNKAIREFTAEANYYWFDSKDGNDFTNTRYLYNTDSELSTYARLEENINDRRYFQTKLNYVHPIGLSAKIDAGYQFYDQHLSYLFKVNRQESTNLFEYAELRNSVYAGITYNLKKTGMQAMLRIEDSHIKADSVTEPDYACFLPSLNLQYKFSASHNLKFTYNRRINRPGIYDMNPYYKLGQNYDITVGNPDLKPDYRDRLQLTYTRNFGSNYFSPYVYQEYYTNKTGRETQLILSSVNNSLTTISKPYNLLSGYESGGGINAMLWFVNINARIYKGHINEYLGQSVHIPSINYYSYSINSSAFVQLDKNKKTVAFILLNYNGVNVNGQSKTYTIPFWGTGAQKQIKNHNIGIVYLLPFSKNVKFSKTVTETPVYNSTNTTGFDVSNYIQFMYSFKFKSGKTVKKLNRTVDVESDSKSQTIVK